MPRAKTTLLQGTLDLIVLQLLQAEPTNGYDLMLRIQAISKDVLNVNAGSLYPALYRLEEQGWVGTTGMPVAPTSADSIIKSAISPTGCRK